MQAHIAWGQQVQNCIGFDAVMGLAKVLYSKLRNLDFILKLKGKQVKVFKLCCRLWTVEGNETVKK